MIMGRTRKNGYRRKQSTASGRKESGTAKAKRSYSKSKERRRAARPARLGDPAMMNRKDNHVVRHHERTMKTNGRVKRQRRRAKRKQRELLVVSGVSKNSVHAAWKRELGGLIRYIVNMPKYREDAESTMKRIEGLYVRSDCDVARTRDSLLLEMVAKNEPGTAARPPHPTDRQQWIDVRVAVAAANSVPNEGGGDGDGYEKICNGGGILLPSVRRRGEGPAHGHETWNVVQVPAWAVSRSFFFQVSNRSPVDLSCQMTVDGHVVAKTVPIPSEAERTIRPDNQRYFVEHEWRFQPSRRIPLARQRRDPATTDASSVVGAPPAARRLQTTSPRCNGKRPASSTYKDERINPREFPDPCEFGWTFTGSAEASRVEFYERRLNFGTVKLDFYYTTGTVKTTLHHPTTGINQLFRKCRIDSETYREILKNPRYHSGFGYRRRRKDHRTGNNHREREEWTNEDENENENEDTDMEEAEAEDGTEEDKMAADPVYYYAKTDNYDFDEAGHDNRTAAMATIEQSPAFQAWKKASKEDWACVHAKFYVSERQYRSRHRVDQGRKRRNNANSTAPLPRMTPIVNVKAAENAVLSTAFHPIGDAAESRLNTASTEKASSRIFMKRINGLNDEDEWGAGPVFETKLYYRLDRGSGDATGGTGVDSVDRVDDGSTMDDDDSDDDVPLAERLAAQMPIETYKDNRFQQLQRWHRNHKAEDDEEAEMKRTFAADAIYASVTIEGVDEHVKEYYDWYQQQEWVAKSKNS